MKKLTTILIVFFIVTFSWYLVADRWTPYTSNAMVKAVVTPLVSEVSGTITDVYVKNGTFVSKGEHLASIDNRSYEIARNMAQADLQLAMQDAGAKSASIDAAQAKVNSAKAELTNVRVQSARIIQLVQDDLASKADGDDARTEILEAESALNEARAELKKARELLGLEGKDNPGVQHAIATLEKAELDLNRTEIVAPSQGGITNLVVGPGAYVSAGTPLLTFIDISEIWVEAYLTENNLGNVQVGSPVELTLDVHPGKIYKGRVISISGAASDETDTKPGTLSSAPKKSGWLRDPKRIPVRIAIDGYEVGKPLDSERFLINGQGDVILYSGESVLLNFIGKVIIRLAAVLSYAY